jgi:hypothetical protein
MAKKVTKRQTTKFSAKPADCEQPAETHGRNFWVMRVLPGERVVLGEMLPRFLMVVQNHGPGKIEIDVGSRKINVPTDHVRLIPTYDRIDVASVDVDKAAIMEFEFMPAAKY